MTSHVGRRAHAIDVAREQLTRVASKGRQRAGALVLCGDLTDTGTPTQAALLIAELRACTVPVIGVLGNHDCESGHANQVKRILCDGAVHLLDGQAAEVDRVALFGVKGFAGGFGPRMLSSFGEPAIKTFVAEAMNEAMRLENIMRMVNRERVVVVLHYAPIAETVEGEPLEIYPLPRMFAPCANDERSEALP